MRKARHAERLGGGDEVALDDRLGGAARDPGDARHRRQADREHERASRRADRRDRDQRQHDLREGQDDVHRPHEDVVQDVRASTPRSARPRRPGRGRSRWRARPSPRISRPPHRNRLQTSWPMWSVPNSGVVGRRRVRRADEGGRAVRSEERAEQGHRDEDDHERERRSACATAASTGAAARRSAGGRLTTSGSGVTAMSEAMAHRRVLKARRDHDRGDVGEHVEDDVDRRDQHRQRLHDRQVVVRDPVTQRAADAGVVEDVLDHDHAAGQVREVDRDHLEGRPERVRQRVTRDARSARAGPSAGPSRRSRTRAPRSSTRA